MQRHLPRHTGSGSKKKKKKKSDGSVPSATTDEAILGASSLLSELLNGKLSATIEGFCRRAASAAKPKRKASGSAEAPAPAGNGYGGMSASAMVSAIAHLPPKARFVELTKVLRRLGRELAISRKVEVTEGAVVFELSRLSELGVFPTDELEAIRREYKLLDRERELIGQDSGLGDNDGYTDSENDMDPAPGSLTARFNELIGPEAANSRVASTTNQAKAPPSFPKRRRTEAELELEFCLRKCAILRHRRQQLEATIAPTKSAGASDKVNINPQGYPMPSNASRRTIAQPPPSDAPHGSRVIKARTTSGRGYATPASTVPSHKRSVVRSSSNSSVQHHHESMKNRARSRAEQRLYDARMYGELHGSTGSASRKGPSPYGKPQRLSAGRRR